MGTSIGSTTPSLRPSILLVPTLHDLDFFVRSIIAATRKFAELILTALLAAYSASWALIKGDRTKDKEHTYGLYRYPVRFILIALDLVILRISLAVDNTSVVSPALGNFRLYKGTLLCRQNQRRR